jgi:hypothetical protein
MHEWAVSDKPIDKSTPAIPAGIQVRCFYSDGRNFGLNKKQLFFQNYWTW